MTIRTFWTIFLKILGIWLLLDCMHVIPQYFSSLFFTTSDEFIWTTAMWFGIMTLTIIFYLFIMKIFLFKTSWLIDKLKLDKDFKEENINLRINSETVLRIATLMTGGFILVDSLPAFCSQLISLYQKKIVFKMDPNVGWLVYRLIEIIIGYLLLTNSKTIVAYIERQSKTE